MRFANRARKKAPKKIEQTEQAKKNNPADNYIPKLSDSKLKDLSWSLGVKDSIYSDNHNK